MSHRGLGRIATGGHPVGCRPAGARGARGRAGGESMRRVWWAVPGGTAMPGQPVAEVVQAPNTLPRSKNQFNILTAQCAVYQILS